MINRVRVIHLELPYGKWTCADGREVLFNRAYFPLYEKMPGEPPTFVRPPYQHVPFVRQEWFYDDGNSPVGCPATARFSVEQLRLFGAPINSVRQSSAHVNAQSGVIVPHTLPGHRRVSRTTTASP